MVWWPIVWTNNNRNDGWYWCDIRLLTLPLVQPLLESFWIWSLSTGLKSCPYFKSTSPPILQAKEQNIPAQPFPGFIIALMFQLVSSPFLRLSKPISAKTSGRSPEDLCNLAMYLPSFSVFQGKRWNNQIRLNQFLAVGHLRISN